MEAVNHQYNKGLWSEEEDRILMEYVKVHGRGKWNRIPKTTSLKRGGKSCRLRWMNYLSPNVKHGDFSEEEDDLIIRLHKLLGNRWSLIARRVPGRTDNQVKNHWNTRLCKRLGVEKENRKFLDSSKPQSTKVENNLRLPLDSNPKPIHNNNMRDIEVTMSEGDPFINGVGASNRQAESVWFTDDQFNLEFLDGYSTDQVRQLGCNSFY